MNLLRVFILSVLCTFAYSTCIEKRAAFQSNKIGTYVPQCDEQVPEKYNAIQCHGSIGYCWCVDTETGGTLSDVFHAWESNKRCE